MESLKAILLDIEEAKLEVELVVEVLEMGVPVGSLRNDVVEEEEGEGDIASTKSAAKDPKGAVGGEGWVEEERPAARRAAWRSASIASSSADNSVLVDEEAPVGEGSKDAA